MQRIVTSAMASVALGVVAGVACVLCEIVIILVALPLLPHYLHFFAGISDAIDAILIVNIGLSVVILWTALCWFVLPVFAVTTTDIGSRMIQTRQIPTQRRGVLFFGSVVLTRGIAGQYIAPIYYSIAGVAIAQSNMQAFLHYVICSCGIVVNVLLWMTVFYVCACTLFLIHCKWPQLPLKVFALALAGLVLVMENVFSYYVFILLLRSKLPLAIETFLPDNMSNLVGYSLVSDLLGIAISSSLAVVAGVCAMYVRSYVMSYPTSDSCSV